MRRGLYAVLTFAACAGLAAAGNWPGFRGPHGDGRTEEKGVPVTWGAEDVRWKVPLPEEGNSSPVVWGDRVFLSQPLDRAGRKRALLCLDRANGKTLWQREVEYAEKEPTHATNPFCSATPATD